MTKPQTEPAFDLTTKPGYMAFHSWCTERMKDITRRKNADYTGDSTDPFANFAVVSKVGVCTTEQGFLVRMCDKLMRISALSAEGKEAQVKDEAVEDTLLDLANYSILLAGYLRSRRARSMQQQGQIQNLLDHVK